MRKRVVTRLEILIAGDALVATLNAQDRFANPQSASEQSRRSPGDPPLLVGFNLLPI